MKYLKEYKKIDFDDFDIQEEDEYFINVGDRVLSKVATINYENDDGNKFHIRAEAAGAPGSSGIIGYVQDIITKPDGTSLIKVKGYWPWFYAKEFDVINETNESKDIDFEDFDDEEFDEDWQEVNSNNLKDLQIGMKFRIISPPNTYNSNYGKNPISIYLKFPIEGVIKNIDTHHQALTMEYHGNLYGVSLIFHNLEFYEFSM
jgi:hypothetical protein